MTKIMQGLVLLSKFKSEWHKRRGFVRVACFLQSVPILRFFGACSVFSSFVLEMMECNIRNILNNLPLAVYLPFLLEWEL